MTNTSPSHHDKIVLDQTVKELILRKLCKRQRLYRTRAHRVRRFAGNTERKGRGHTEQDPTEWGESPKIQRVQAEAIQNKTR